MINVWAVVWVEYFSLWSRPDSLKCRIAAPTPLQVSHHSQLHTQSIPLEYIQKFTEWKRPQEIPEHRIKSEQRNLLSHRIAIHGNVIGFWNCKTLW